MIKVGSLVKYKFDGDIGLVVDHWVHDQTGEPHIVIRWSCGFQSDHSPTEFEVLS